MDGECNYRDLPLVTIGDAAASFLEFPDQFTEGLEFASIEDFREGRWPSSDDPEGRHSRFLRLMRPTRRFRAISPKRWMTAFGW